MATVASPRSPARFGGALLAGRRLDAAWALLGAACVTRTVVALALGLAPADDAYITFRYSLNLADGHGLVYNAGEHVLGTTTPLWALLLSPAHVVGLSLPAAALVVALVCDVLSALLVRALLEALGYARVVSFGAAVLFLAMADFLGLSRSGMETSLFTMLVLLTLWLLARERPAAAVWAGCAAALARPEGLIVLGVVAGWCVMRRRMPSVRRALPALLLLAAWVAFAWSFYGSPVPQSLVAKSAYDNSQLRSLSWHNFGMFFLEGQSGGGATTRTWLQASFALSLLAVAGMWSVVRARSWERVLLVLGFPVVYAAAHAVTHSFTYFPWYYAPLYPFLAALAVAGLAVLVRRRALVVTGVAVLAGLQIAALVAVKLPGESHHFWVRGLRESVAQVPARAGVSVASGEIGVIGWKVYPARVEDLAGLVTPGVVDRWPAGYVIRTRPAYVALRTDNGHRLALDMQNVPALRNGYRLVKRIPDPYRPIEYRLYARRG